MFVIMCCTQRHAAERRFTFTLLRTTGVWFWTVYSLRRDLVHLVFNVLFIHDCLHFTSLEILCLLKKMETANSDITFSCNCK